MWQLLEYAAYYGIFASVVYLIALFRGADLVIAWYDLWVGLFVDQSKRRWYLFLIPCVGVKFQRSTPEPHETLRQYMDRAFAEKEALFEKFFVERRD